MTNGAVSVDQVVRRPETVTVIGHGAQVVVESNLVGDVVVLGTSHHVDRNFLKGVLRRVDADDVESQVFVRVVPAVYVRDPALAVDAGVRQEVDQHDLAAQLIQNDFFVVCGVEPLLDARDFWGCSAAFSFGRTIRAEVEILVLFVLESAKVELFRDLLGVAELILPADLAGELTTVNGATVTVAGSGDALTVNGANVICGGVQTANATVYLIDGVLTPPAGSREKSVHVLARRRLPSWAVVHTRPSGSMAARMVAIATFVSFACLSR